MIDSSAITSTLRSLTENNDKHRIEVDQHYLPRFLEGHGGCPEPADPPGAAAAYAVGIVYLLIALAILADDFFCPTLEIIAGWMKLSPDVAGATLQAAPLRAPDSVNPGTTPYAGSFASNCQATNYNDAQQQECAFNGQQGFCGNWWSAMNNTGQPLFPNENCVKDVRGEITMPWCSCMVGKGNC